MGTGVLVGCLVIIYHQLCWRQAVLTIDPLTPFTLAATLDEQLLLPPPPPPPPLPSHPMQEELLREAALAVAGGEHRRAADTFRDALELDPQSEPALSGLFAALDATVGPGKGPQMGPNATEAFSSTMTSQIESGQAERLSPELPVFLLHGLLSRSEAQQILQIRERRRARWTAVPALVCFDHPVFQRSARLQPHWRHGIGGSGSRSCLTQDASQAVAARLPQSESLAVYHGEEELLDEVGRRLERRAGLPSQQGINFQLLTYDAGSSYQLHTDCMEGQDLYEARSPVRMASVLVYLSDDFDGGATEFPRLQLRVKPPVGSAVVFYSYDTTPKCDIRSEHRAARVERGTKHVLQRWYSYRCDPLFDLRPWRRENDVGLRLPWQAVIKCDQMPERGEDGADVSCRWYNKPTDFAYYR